MYSPDTKSIKLFIHDDDCVTRKIFAEASGMLLSNPDHAKIHRHTHIFDADVFNKTRENGNVN